MNKRNVEHDDKLLLDTNEAVALLQDEGLSSCTLRTLQDMRRRGAGPPYLRFARAGRGAVRYVRHDLLVWLQGCRVDPESHRSAARGEERP